MPRLKTVPRRRGVARVAGMADGDSVNLMMAGAGVAGTLAVQTWGIVQFFLNRIGEMDAKRSDDIAKLHERIDAVSRDSVRREDYHRDQEALRGDLRDFRTDVKTTLGAITSRLDAIIHKAGAPAAE